MQEAPLRPLSSPGAPSVHHGDLAGSGVISPPGARGPCHVLILMFFYVTAIDDPPDDLFQSYLGVRAKLANLSFPSWCVFRPEEGARVSLPGPGGLPTSRVASLNRCRAELTCPAGRASPPCPPSSPYLYFPPFCPLPPQPRLPPLASIWSFQGRQQRKAPKSPPSKCPFPPLALDLGVCTCVWRERGRETEREVPFNLSLYSFF